MALAAETLRTECGVERLAIVDFDVHHGNGTQHAFESDPDVLFVSLHGDPRYLYPGTGYAAERGRGRGEGTTINVPLPPGSDDARFRTAVEEQVIPVVERHRPELLLLSAGFDAHVDDPLGNLALTDELYGWLTAVLCQVADRLSGGRVVSVLEGGYNTRVLERCVSEHVRVLAGA